MHNTEQFRNNTRQHTARLEQAIDSLKIVVEPEVLAPGNLIRAREIAEQIATEMSAVIQEAGEQLSRRQFADTIAPIVVEVGAGLVKALRLNDVAVCRSFGNDGIRVKVEHGRALITGKPDALLSLRRQCEHVSKGTGAQPLWHSASAMSALRKLDPVLHR